MYELKAFRIQSEKWNRIKRFLKKNNLELLYINKMKKKDGLYYGDLICYKKVNK